MALRRVQPPEAHRLLQEEGFVYLDVRSIPEYEEGHAPGAYNVPLLHLGPMGMTPNPDFLDVVRAAFPTEAKIVTGCKAGGRSLRAAEMLAQAGYANVVDMQGGFHGEYGPMRNLVAKGWSMCDLPVEREPQPGHAYEALAAKK